MKEENEFEKYKIFIDLAKETNDKRITQNNIYVTINLAFIAYISTHIVNIRQNIIMISILICLVLFSTINNYAKRNKVKFDIINESKIGILYKENGKELVF